MYKAQILINGIEEAAVFAKTKAEARLKISNYAVQYLQDCKGEKVEMVLSEAEDV